MNFYESVGGMPAHMLALDLDATMQSLFAPMELSPSEQMRWGNALGFDKDPPNPFVQTIKDLATNPLMWVGLGMSMVGSPIRPSQWAAIRDHGVGYIRKVAPFMRGLTSPFSSFRNLVGQWKGQPMDVMEDVLSVVRHSVDFKTRYLQKMDDLVLGFQKVKGAKITPREWKMVDMWLRGWHKPNPPFLTPGQHFPPFLAWMRENVPDQILAPGLEKAMGRDLLKFAGGVRNEVLDPIAKEALIPYYQRLMKEAGAKGMGKAQARIVAELQNKGSEILDFLGRGVYAPRVTKRSGFVELLKGRGAATREWATFLRGTWTKKHEKLRIGFSIPDPDELKEVADLMHPKALEGISTMPIEVHRYLRLVLDKIPEALPLIARKVGGFVPAGAGGEWVYKTQSQLPGAFRNWLGEALKGTHLGAGKSAIIMNRIDEMFQQVPGIHQIGDPRKQAIVAREALRPQLDALAAALTPARFSLNPSKYMTKYVSSVSSTFGYHTTGLGDKIEKLLRTHPKVEPWQLDIWYENLKPTLRGVMSTKEYARRMHFDSIKAGLVGWLSDPKNPVVSKLPQQSRKWLVDGLTGKLSESTVGGKLASLLYTSSLGLNVSPISKNLFQNLITTLNHTGPRPMIEGTRHVIGKLSTYTDEIQAGMKKGLGWGKAQQEAFKKAFPEYFKHFGFEHTLTHMTAGDIAKETAAAAKFSRGAWDLTKQAVMGPFALSEKFNRLVGFYAYRAHALADGVAIPAAERYAQMFTLYSHFGGGAIGIPNAIRHLPVPLRQFMHFPLRYLEWLYGSTALGQDPTKLSLSLMGRTLAGSTAMYYGFKNFWPKLDVSGGLLVGALPIPAYEGSPFYPMPIVPPALGMVGDVAKSVLKGDYGGLAERVGPMMVPAGLAAKRAWKTWAPRYAGYDQQTSDGRIPVFNREGMLISHQTPTQLALRGLGLRPVSVEQEQTRVQWLLRQRDKIRVLRRNFVEAVAAGDERGALRVQAQWAKQYPQLGPLTFKKSDLSAVQNRRQLTRIQRILRSIPQEHRGPFELATSMSSFGHMAQSIDQYGAPGFAF